MNIKNRYKSSRKETQETIKLLVGSDEIEDAYIPSLDLLVLNYDMLYKANEDINQYGFRYADNRQREQKNPSVQTFFASQNIINNILRNFPTSPMSKAKLNKLSKIEDDVDDSAISEYM